jgi:AraC-like DNA-binding protein
MKTEVDKPKGVLHLVAGQQKFKLSRHLPSHDCGCFIQHYWIVQWNLESHAPHVQEVLPHPSVHLVFEKNKSRIVGVMQGKFSRLLRDKGQVFGIKFRPGAFYPFLKSPVSNLTDKTINVSTVFGKEGEMLEDEILSLKDRKKMVARAENFFQANLPMKDENITLVNRITDFVIQNRQVTKVDHIVDHFDMHKRMLQRLFTQYVGVSAKWVIKRYRLHEAIDCMAQGDTIDWLKLACDLGYFDQAHFIKDFKSIVGKSPEEYMKSGLSPASDKPTRVRE